MPREPRCTIFRDPGGDRIVRVAETTRCANGSILLVPAGSVAFFVLNGDVSSPYGPGRYEINTGVNPFFVKYRHFMTGGDPGITVNVFYVALDLETHLQMGSGDVIFTEKRYRQTVRARAAFSVDYHVCEPRRFLSSLVGMHSGCFYMEDIEPKIESLLCGPIVEEMSRRFADAEIGALNRNLSAISSALLPSVSQSFSNYGLELVRFQIRHISINNDDITRLQGLENMEAEGVLKTDIEKYNLKQIYGGDVHLRTGSEVLTGMPRGPYPPAASPPAGTSLGSLAAGLMFLRSIPEDTWRPIVDSIARGTGTVSGANTETTGNPPENGRILPPIRRK